MTMQSHVSQPVTLIVRLNPAQAQQDFTALLTQIVTHGVARQVVIRQATSWQAPEAGLKPGLAAKPAWSAEQLHTLVMGTIGDLVGGPVDSSAALGSQGPDSLAAMELRQKLQVQLLWLMALPSGLLGCQQQLPELSVCTRVLW